MSFLKNKYTNDKIVEFWDLYLLNPTITNYNRFKTAFRLLYKTYFYPNTSDLIFLYTFTPENFLKHVKDQMPHIWNKHVNEKEITKKEMIYSYTKIFNPNFNDEDYEEYLFLKSFNGAYLSENVKQQKNLYNLFNKQLTKNIKEDILFDQESMIMNFNNIEDCKALAKVKNCLTILWMVSFIKRLALAFLTYGTISYLTNATKN